MRKLLFFFFALLASVSGAWAEVTQPTLTTDVNNPVYYTIQSKRSSNYATFNGEGRAVTHEPGIGWGSIWYFVKNGEGVSLVPAAVPSMKINASKVAAASGAVWYLKESSISGYFCISKSATDVTNGTSTTRDCWDASNSNTSIGDWYNKEGDADGTSWTIAAIGNVEVNSLKSAYNGMIPNLPNGKYLSVGDQATTITAATSGDDNDHWYIISQDRGGTTTPMYNTGYYTNLKRAATSVTPQSLVGQALSLNEIYLIRFVDAGDGLYNIQFADGSYIVNPTTGEPANGNNPKLTYYGPQAKFAFTLIEGSTRFSWNLHNATGKSMDNNGVNATVSYFGTGTETDATATKSWMIQPVTFTDAISYSFTTTDGAFFAGLSTNKAAAATNYCNLWLSKNTAGKPQLKLITNDASANGGNNMRSTGGLYTTTSAYQYNLSVSEGKIKSYTIVGTAVGALSITPDGGSAEEFAASASVSKKVTLDTPAKETSFKLATLGGDAQWLDVTKFIIEYESDATTVTSLSDITNAGIYTLEPHNAERGVMYAGTTYMDACGGHANTYYPANSATAIDATDLNQQFVLYTYGGNTYLYNVGRAKFAGVADDLYYKLTGAPVNTWTVSAGAYDKYFHLTSGADSKMATINAWNTATATMKGQTIASGKDYAVTGTTDNEEANNFLLRQVGTLTSEQQAAIETIITNYLALQTSLTSLNEYTIGTGLNQYKNASLPNNEAKESAITNIQEGLKDCESSVIPTANTQVQALITTMSLNKPSANTFLRIKGYATNKYAKAGSVAASIASATQIPNSVNQESDGSDIWCYDAENHLVNYKNGLGTIQTHSFAPVGQTMEVMTFAASTCTAKGAKKVGVYEIKSNYSGSQVWYSNTNNVDRNSANNHVNCEWVLEEVTTLPVTISAAGYATLNAPVALTIPSGVTAYTGEISGEYLVLSEVSTTIPANTPVVLKGTAGTYNFDITTGGSVSATNKLSGTVAAIAWAAGNYTLQYDGSDVASIGFYADAATDNIIPGFKAYLASASGVKGYSLELETAVKAIEAATNPGKVVYDLNGRRVENPAKGLYIVNGKKVIIK
jgi:hypothetical protein